MLCSSQRKKVIKIQIKMQQCHYLCKWSWSFASDTTTLSLYSGKVFCKNMHEEDTKKILLCCYFVVVALNEEQIEIDDKNVCLVSFCYDDAHYLYESLHLSLLHSFYSMVRDHYCYFFFLSISKTYSLSGVKEVLLCLRDGNNNIIIEWKKMKNYLGMHNIIIYNTRGTAAKNKCCDR